MKRASIGLALLVAFFLLAMFLMADAEVEYAAPAPGSGAVPSVTQRGG